LENQTRWENILVNNRDLILKKGLTNDYYGKYKQILNKTHQIAKREDLISTLSYVVPSYSLIKLSKYLFFSFITDIGSYESSIMVTNLFESVKKMIERIR